MFYKNTRNLSKEVNELHEKDLINDESKNSIQAYYEKFVNIALNNALTFFVAFAGLFFLFGGLSEVSKKIVGAISGEGAKAVSVIFSFIPFALATFLFVMGYKHEESRVNVPIKEFTTTFLFGSFLYFILALNTTYGIVTDPDIKRWIFLLLFCLIGIGLTLFRNSTGAMVLTIPLIFKFTFSLNMVSFFKLAKDPFVAFDMFAANSYYIVGLILFCAVFLHFWLNVDTLTKKQDFKPVAMGWTASILGYVFFLSIIPGNYLLFTVVYILGLYIFGKLYFDDNPNWFGRPLQTMALLLSSLLLFSISFSGGLQAALASTGFYGIELFKSAPWDFWLWLIVLLGMGAALYYFYVKPMYIDGEGQFNPLIIALPIFIFFIMLLGLLEWITFPKILINLYLIGLCVYLMVNGSQEKYHAMYLLGIFTLYILMASRYADMSVHWTLKALFFILVGASFFGIAFTLKDRTDGHENP